jgi:hypothetical protein
MNLVEIARNNFNSWNRHDADAIVAAYAERKFRALQLNS